MIELAHLERGLLHRPGTLHPGHADRRRAGLLLSAQSAAGRHAVAQTADSSALESGDHGQRHQLRVLRPDRKAPTPSTRCRPVDYSYRLRYFDKLATAMR